MITSEASRYTRNPRAHGASPRSRRDDAREHRQDQSEQQRIRRPARGRCHPERPEPPGSWMEGAREPQRVARHRQVAPLARRRRRARYAAAPPTPRTTTTPMIVGSGDDSSVVFSKSIASPVAAIGLAGESVPCGSVASAEIVSVDVLGAVRDAVRRQGCCSEFGPAQFHAARPLGARLPREERPRPDSLRRPPRAGSSPAVEPAPVPPAVVPQARPSAVRSRGPVIATRPLRSCSCCQVWEPAWSRAAQPVAQRAAPARWPRPCPWRTTSLRPSRVAARERPHRGCCSTIARRAARASTTSTRSPATR